MTSVTAAKYREIPDGNLCLERRYVFQQVKDPAIKLKLHTNRLKTTNNILCFIVAKSKVRPQSKWEFVSGFEEGYSLMIPR